ncbi:MAG: ABC transporter permease [Spirochaetales bacterium]|nr:ABC transporter permease [Spirochaetales bacterium]
MKSVKWIFHISFRYFLTKRKEKGHTASILSIAGITVGVMTLIGVIAVMNGFQQGFITNINEIRSYHIRIEGEKSLDPRLRDEILAVEGVSAVSPFVDIQTIIQGFMAEQSGAAIRAVEPSILDQDHGFAEKIKIADGAFDLTEERSIVLGADLAFSLGLRVGDRVSLLSLAGKGYDKLSPVNLEFVVTGTFRSGYYEINSTMAFIPIADAPLFAPEEDTVFGLKLINHYRDREILRNLKKIPGLEGLYMESWREYNKSFFSALLMEKLMMMVLISLIFLVVAVNIFHSMKRSVVERIEEVALLKAVGAAPFSVQSVFILEGAIIGVLGSAAGTVFGFLVTKNINTIFGFVESAVNAIRSIGKESINDFSIYTGSSYYLQRVPVEIMTPDVIYITSVALFSALAAAWMASRGVASVKPAVVLRYE